MKLTELQWAVLKVEYIVPNWVTFVPGPLSLILQKASPETTFQDTFDLVLGIITRTFLVELQHIYALQSLLWG